MRKLHPVVGALIVVAISFFLSAVAHHLLPPLSEHADLAIGYYLPPVVGYGAVVLLVGVCQTRFIAKVGLFTFIIIAATNIVVFWKVIGSEYSVFGIILSAFASQVIALVLLSIIVWFSRMLKKVLRGPSVG